MEDKPYSGCPSDSPFMLKGIEMATKKLCILGSTGSIGTQALELVDDLGIKVTALSAQSSVEKMEEQIRRFSPPVVCMKEEKAASELAARIRDTNTKVLSGEDGLIQLIHESDADTVLTSIPVPARAICSFSRVSNALFGSVLYSMFGAFCTAGSRYWDA